MFLILKGLTSINTGKPIYITYFLVLDFWGVFTPACRGQTWASSITYTEKIHLDKLVSSCNSVVIKSNEAGSFYGFLNIIWSVKTFLLNICRGFWLCGLGEWMRRTDDASTSEKTTPGFKHRQTHTRRVTQAHRTRRAQCVIAAYQLHGEAKICFSQSELVSHH